MAGNAEVAGPGNRPDDGLGRLVWSTDRLLRPIEDALNGLAAIATLFLMLLGVVQIILRARWLFNSPIRGYVDMIELAMPILAILGIAYCQRQGVHIRMDILMQRFQGRVLWVIETFAAAVSLVIILLLTWFAWVFFHDAYISGDSTIDIQLLTWPSKILAPIAFGLLALRMVVQMLGGLRLAMDSALEPVGVVVMKDIAEQARDEIREALGEEGVR